jgi:hypothetical protein
MEQKSGSGVRAKAKKQNQWLKNNTKLFGLIGDSGPMIGPESNNIPAFIFI